MKHGKRRMTCFFALAMLGTVVPSAAGAQRAVPVEVQGTAGVTVVNGPLEEVPVAVSREVPISFSGVWNAAGLALPSMIVHDIIFFAADVAANSSCIFTMNYVLDQFNSRLIRRIALSEFNSVELHYEAGIDTATLRFGTVGGSTCTRHWVAMGFAKP